MSLIMTELNKSAPIILAMTGASGACYGLRLLECLVKDNRQVYLLISKAAQAVFAMETDLDVPSRPSEAQEFFTQHFNAAADQIIVYGREQWSSPVASGSHKAEYMIVCPCTTGTLSSIAQGSSNNLMQRAADVMIKEQRQLMLVVREMPLSSIHLENMLKLANIGVTIMPANPGFYQNPASVNDLVDFVVARILDHIKVEHNLLPRWGL